VKNDNVDIKAMFKVYRYYMALLIIVFSAVSVYAANGLSNEISLNTQWHDLDAATAMSVNPSFPARIDWPTFSTALSSTQMGLYYLVNAQMVLPLSSRAYNSHTVGIAYTGLNAGSVRESHWKSDVVVIDEEPGKSAYTEHYGSMVYAFMPFDVVAVGVTVNVARQSNFGNPVTDGSLDAGMSFALGSPAVGKHVFGLSLRNPACLSRYDIPVFTPDACVSWHFERRYAYVDIKGGFEANYRSFRGETYGSPHRDASARIGAAVNNALSCYVQGGRSHFGIALHVNLDSSTAKIPQFLRRASGACQILFTEEQMRPTSTLYFAGEVKRNRNEVSGDVWNIYLKAMAAMSAEKWVDAYALFALVEKEEPAFIKIDQVRLHSAWCLEKMYLPARSIAQYKKVKSCFSYNSNEQVSEVLGGASLGLLRMYAKVNDSAAFEHEVAILSQAPVDDSIRQHALYITGMWAMEKGDTLGAIVLFAQVRPGHPVFPFAQYSKGVCHVVTNDAEHLTEKSFKEAAESEVYGAAAEEIRYRACYALGCLYYEKNRYADAQRYIERIPATSSIYYEGLSVVCWSLMKSRQWNRCRLSAQKMQESYSAEVQAEGFLLEGYALLCDTLCPQSKELCLQHALQVADKASRLLPLLDVHAATDERQLVRENDSLARETWNLLERFHNELAEGKEHPYLFKCIDGIRSPANYCQYRTDVNLLNLDFARHYHHGSQRLAAMKDDINYFSAKVKMLYERERARREMKSDLSVR